MKKTLKILALFLVAVIAFSSVSFADNPVIENTFTADPAAIVHNGTVYMYVGHDQQADGVEGYHMNNWKVYSSNDMVNWTDRATVHYSTFSWSRGDAWASQVIERNGKFYWYVSTEHNSVSGKAIGVMVADSPTGPWRDARGTALITNNMTPGTSSWADIDPTVFIDDDGQAYMYWGNDNLFYVELNNDMISFSGSIVNVPVKNAAFPEFTEAPFLHKRGSTYYMSYAKGWPESIAYSTSNSPTGPWTYRGEIQPATTTSTTSHQAFLEFNGQNYFISHNGALPSGGNFRRSVIIEEFDYNSDGTIPTINQTSTGIDGNMNRIQSYNFQDRYVRHANYDARIDANVSPSFDQYWQIKPGLANSGSGYVSFESVYFPGYYLRHSNYELVLAKHDGSSLFAADATFRHVPGLADGSWSSFESYNFPDRHIRHYNYELQLDPISTSLDRQDATFRIVN